MTAVVVMVRIAFFVIIVRSSGCHNSQKHCKWEMLDLKRTSHIEVVPGAIRLLASSGPTFRART